MPIQNINSGRRTYFCDCCGQPFIAPYNDKLCRQCLEDHGWEPSYPTNADKLRAMTDEELANSRVGKVVIPLLRPIWVAIDVPRMGYATKEEALAAELTYLRKPAEETTEEVVFWEGTGDEHVRGRQLDAKHIKGDILTPNTSDVAVIVCHQVNCMGKMDSGLARQVKKTYPGVYGAYKGKCDSADVKADLLGDVQFCSVICDAGYIIANVFGQERYGNDGKRYTDYDALRKAFENIAEGFPRDIIRIPYNMGCGLGGGDWGTVSAIIQETLCDKGVEVEIWEYDPSKKEDK